jgi:hypothetical protein
MDNEQLQEEVDEVVKMCKQKGLNQFDAFKIALFYTTHRAEMDKWEDVEPLWEKTIQLATEVGFNSKFGEICLN